MGILHTRKMTLIMALGLIASGIFAMISVPISGPDTIQYDRLGYNLSLGNGFSSDAQAPYEPTMFREPAYPVFLAIIYKIFGHRPEAVVFAQMIMHAITALLSYFLAKDIFSEKVALFSGIAVALFPTLANTSSYLLSETLFTFLLCLVLYVLLRALETKAPYRFILPGVLFGLLALTKVVAIFLPFMLAVIALSVAIAKKRSALRVIAGLVVLLAAFILTVSVWSVRNKALFGTYSITVRSGWSLWSRAEKIDDSPREILTNACYNLSEYLGVRFFPDKTLRPERYLYKDLDRAAELVARYRKDGFSESEADAMLKKEAVAKILKHPGKYLSYTFIEAIKMTAFTYLPILNEPRVANRLSSTRMGHILLVTSKVAMRALSLPIIFLFFFAALKNMLIWDRWILLFAAVLYFNTVCSLVDATGRYGVPLIPFYCVMASGAFFRPRHIQEA